MFVYRRHFSFPVLNTAPPSLPLFPLSPFFSSPPSLSLSLYPSFSYFIRIYKNPFYIPNITFFFLYYIYFHFYTFLSTLLFDMFFFLTFFSLFILYIFILFYPYTSDPHMSLVPFRSFISTTVFLEHTLKHFFFFYLQSVLSEIVLFDFPVSSFFCHFSFGVFSIFISRIIIRNFRTRPLFMADLMNIHFYRRILISRDQPAFPDAISNIQKRLIAFG